MFAPAHDCSACPLALLCLGGYLSLIRCHNCQRLIVINVEQHLIGYPYGNQTGSEVLEEGGPTPTATYDSCPRCNPFSVREGWRRTPCAGG